MNRKELLLTLAKAMVEIEQEIEVLTKGADPIVRPLPQKDVLVVSCRKCKSAYVDKVSPNVDPAYHPAFCNKCGTSDIDVQRKTVKH